MKNSRIIVYFIPFLFVLLGDLIIFLFSKTVNVIYPFLKKISFSVRNPSRKIKTKKPPKEIVIYSATLSLARQIRAFFLGVFLTLLFVIVPYSFYSIINSLPNPKLLQERSYDVSTKIYDRNGLLLYEIYAEENRTPIALEKLPEHIVNATIAIEDRDFYRHNGFSVRSIIRALRETVINHNIQGGSTITQQLIKSALLNPEISLIRKIKEIILAYWAERIYTKDQILEMYLNQVPYGGTAWGIEAASQTYFSVTASDLTLAQAALLAGLPQAPSEYSPYGSDPKKALLRQRQVLDAMVANGFISSSEAVDALSENIVFTPQHTDIKAPHFVMYIREKLEKTYGTRLIERAGLRIRTSLDLNKHQQAQEIVKKTIGELTALKVGNGAVVVTNPKNGEILSMVGSTDYFNEEKDGNVNVTTSLRQPGSAIKVITYALALENNFTPDSLIDDSPVSYRSSGSPVYTPVNYDGRFHGQVTLRQALANSYNIPAVRLLSKVGIQPMIKKAGLMGIDTWINPERYGLSITLGGADVTMLDMAEVYGSLANGGFRQDLNAILEIRDYTGRLIYQNSPDTGVRAVSPGAAFIISDILSDNAERTPAFGANSQLYFPGHTVAVKTGTSNDKRDNWTIGYTPDYVVAVWVGNNDNSPMDPVLASGVTGAAPIFHRIMESLLTASYDRPFLIPDDITVINCPGKKTGYFIKGTEPKNGCLGNYPPKTTKP